MRVLHRTVELQDNDEHSRDRLAGTASVLSVTNHPSRDQRQGSVQRREAAPEADAGNLCQPISVVAVKKRTTLPARGPVAIGHIGAYPDPQRQGDEALQAESRSPAIALEHAHVQHLSTMFRSHGDHTPIHMAVHSALRQEVLHGHKTRSLGGT